MNINISEDKIIYDNRTYTYTDSYIFEDGKLFYISANGQHCANQRAYRQAGDYALYIDSFPSAALPYSRYRIADKRTGRVYDAEVLQGMRDEKTHIKGLVAELKNI